MDIGDHVGCEHNAKIYNNILGYSHKSSPHVIHVNVPKNLPWTQAEYIMSSTIIIAYNTDFTDKNAAIYKFM